jgi:hypothetical protein
MNQLAHCPSIAQQACEECTRSDSINQRNQRRLAIQLTFASTFD